MISLTIAGRSKPLQTLLLTLVGGAACATQETLPFEDDDHTVGGAMSSGGAGAHGGGSAGTTAGGHAGGASNTGGSVSNGGAGMGGTQAAGGSGAGGAANGGTGGSAGGAAGLGAGGAGSTGGTGGTTTAGTGAGGRGGAGIGGAGRSNGGAGAGGTGTAGSGTAGSGTAGTGTAGAPSTTLDCSAVPAMPTGGTVHNGNSQGGSNNLAWQIWSNGGSGSLTTFSTAAFIATWNNSGDYLGRLGWEFGNSGKTFASYGDITADLAFKKNGTAGQYSYVGIYGWTTNPCIEWYIVDDSYSMMPFNTGNPVSGTVDLDGGTYNLVKRNTSGTGGNRCGNVSNWDQFYSIRHTGRQCGTISVTEHFKIWDAKGWKLGNLLEVKILVEAASGQGSVEFAVADVKKTM
ncbi:MAG TPA: glycoside hydrolase family 11 protein [Polyangiaceae bacterium]|nr:glycoside hydrolase family 11 protein [Polyangiaceae bacterium]